MKEEIDIICTLSGIWNEFGRFVIEITPLLIAFVGVFALYYSIRTYNNQLFVRGMTFTIETFIKEYADKKLFSPIIIDSEETTSLKQARNKLKEDFKSCSNNNCTHQDENCPIVSKILDEKTWQNKTVYQIS